MIDPSFQNKARVDKLLLRCSVPPQTQGFDFLSEAVCLYSTKNYKNISEVYEEIGRARNYPESKVHRYADYSLSHAKNAADVINELFGTHYTKNDLHNKLVVALLAQYIKLHNDDMPRTEE